ncbi:MAG: NADH-quinone oxidoreductase subunit N [Deltaproteobacteria bacterium]|nr:NADH-quinone oxidoreductase subunit N [Deltaproteobacteria bacterium]
MLETLSFILPELSLTLTLCTLLLVGLKFKNKFLLYSLVKMGVLATFIFLVWGGGGYLNSVSIFSNSLSIDPLSRFFKILILFPTLFCSWFALNSYELHEKSHIEALLLILGSTLGMFFLVSSSDLLMIYLSLETVSIFSYVLAGIRKKHALSNEASVKYMIFGTFVSGGMLYGLSLLYGMTGSLNLLDIATQLKDYNTHDFSLLFISLLIFGGFAYKISAVPFHMWTPDVYEGAPTPITTFFSTAPKVAGFAVLIRFFYVVFSTQMTEGGVTIWATTDLHWPEIVALLSAITMTVGNFAALSQTNVKRLLAYSTIAHSGYILMGFVVLGVEGLEAVLFYTLVYIFMKLGAFFVTQCVGNKFKNEELSSFKEIGWKSPLLGISMTLFLFALIGLPPTSGFIGKFYLFNAALHKGLLWLVIVAIFNSVVSLYYYAKILKALYLEKSEKEFSFTLNFFDSYVLVFLSVAVMLLGIYVEPFIHWVKASVYFIVG